MSYCWCLRGVLHSILYIFIKKKIKSYLSAGCSPVELNLSTKVLGDSLVEAFWILFVAGFVKTQRTDSKQLLFDHLCGKVLVVLKHFTDNTARNEEVFTPLAKPKKPWLI